VINPSGESKVYYLGPHAPSLRPDDVQLVHRLWLNLRRDPSIQDLHHSDIITYALTRLASQYAREKQEIIKDLRGYKSADIPAGLKLGAPDSVLAGAAYSTSGSNQRSMDHSSKE
jgi:hypothetical protein